MAEDEPLLDPVVALGADGDAEAVVGMGRRGQGAHCVDHSIGRRSRRTESTRLDDGCPTLLNCWDERVFEPSLVVDDIRRGVAGDACLIEIGIHR